jgi:hypothetical protein
LLDVIGWPLEPIEAAIVGGLASAAAAAETEQAVRGIDSLDELALHAVLAASLRTAGFGVHREVRYPSARGKKRRSEGRRCDLVLTAGGRPLDEDAGQLGLFSAPSCPLADALWLEVKLVAQFLEGRPNRGYGAALQGPIWRDFEKLGADPTIAFAVQLVLLFTADDATAVHDLGVTLERARARGLMFEAPRTHRFPVGDRLGNTRCTAALLALSR